ncbi:CoA-transferase family III [Aaosphaeria arxii CBS 175.79]|uniref:CoA-transferase family III n=1 Tax=Aaosphaeria arxii CBS 175.79 TaxID=1450172 RepID=A0A6A5XRJ2_9PLEO|nr:CoA-transferase family III [Aaosphaeria arxii CBS 175.79]KAF2015553.1 CoA-transferase family III [Aaosphaeria arxii CBS 175.79]
MVTPLFRALKTLKLPESALRSVHIIEDGSYLPSSFKVDILAQSSIAVSALAASLFYSHRRNSSISNVSISTKHSCAEFKSERLYTLCGKPARPPWGVLGGLHKTSDGYIRMHDSFPDHRACALRILGLEENATRSDVAGKMLTWKAVELEKEAFQSGAVILALRSFEEWDALPQAKALSDCPILLEKLKDSSPYSPAFLEERDHKCLQGVRVVELSRVIAAPVAGKTLAAHGADVVWVTSPNLPDLPDLDRDLSRGKRTVQLDINKQADKEKLLDLIRSADVFIQGYRPGSLAAKQLSPEELTKLNPNLIIANMSAWGPTGPWARNRGFDSLVQTATGLNVAEAKAYGEGEVAHVLPCQALDHGAGYLLATGAIAALYKRATKGGAYRVDVSLAGVGKYLRSLGRYEGMTGFERQDIKNPEDVSEYLETRESGFGELVALRHSVTLEGLDVGWDIMPMPLGSHEPRWIG